MDTVGSSAGEAATMFMFCDNLKDLLHQTPVERLRHVPPDKRWYVLNSDSSLREALEVAPPSHPNQCWSWRCITATPPKPR